MAIFKMIWEPHNCVYEELREGKVKYNKKCNYGSNGKEREESLLAKLS